MYIRKSTEKKTAEGHLYHVNYDKEIVLKELNNFVNNIFLLPEIDCVKIRDVIIKRDAEKAAKLQEAVMKSFHDCYSDVDMSVVVKISTEDSTTPVEYMRNIERFGINTESCLGFCFVEENNMYRIIFKNGMRYDFGFEFKYDDSVEMIMLQVKENEYNNPNWPMEKINRFWFVQIQALGKLYRKDFLISNHLANMNLNETLVQQMVLRDIEHGTNHHRYGYKEEIEYMRNKGKCPIKTGDTHFELIADKIYCAALTYDELTLLFYPMYQKRCADFMEIWKCYEQGRIASC